MVQTFASYRPDTSMCQGCQRPRDNYHSTLCPICLRYGTQQGPPLKPTTEA